MTPAWPWALALTVALGALIVSQVQLREARGEVHRLRALLSDVTKGTLRQLEQAEAAIARVRDVCSQSRGVVHVGCRCFTDECSGTCGAGKPLAWNLDPTDVLLAMKGGGE